MKVWDAPGTRVVGKAPALRLNSLEPDSTGRPTVRFPLPTLDTVTHSYEVWPTSTWPKSTRRGSTSMSGIGSCWPPTRRVTVGSSGSSLGISTLPVSASWSTGV